MAISDWRLIKSTTPEFNDRYLIKLNGSREDIIKFYKKFEKYFEVPCGLLRDDFKWGIYLSGMKVQELELVKNHLSDITHPEIKSKKLQTEEVDTSKLEIIDSTWAWQQMQMSEGIKESGGKASEKEPVGRQIEREPAPPQETKPLPEEEISLPDDVKPTQPGEQQVPSAPISDKPPDKPVQKGSTQKEKVDSSPDTPDVKVNEIISELNKILENITDTESSEERLSDTVQANATGHTDPSLSSGEKNNSTPVSAHGDETKALNELSKMIDDADVTPGDIRSGAEQDKEPAVSEQKQEKPQFPHESAGKPDQPIDEPVEAPPSLLPTAEEQAGIAQHERAVEKQTEPPAKEKQADVTRHKHPVEKPAEPPERESHEPEKVFLEPVEPLPEPDTKDPKEMVDIPVHGKDGPEGASRDVREEQRPAAKEHGFDNDKINIVLLIPSDDKAVEGTFNKNISENLNKVSKGSLTAAIVDTMAIDPQAFDPQKVFLQIKSCKVEIVCFAGLDNASSFKLSQLISLIEAQGISHNQLQKKQLDKQFMYVGIAAGMMLTKRKIIDRSSM